MNIEKKDVAIILLSALGSFLLVLSATSQPFAAIAAGAGSVEQPVGVSDASVGVSGDPNPENNPSKKSRLGENDLLVRQFSCKSPRLKSPGPAPVSTISAHSRPTWRHLLPPPLPPAI